MDIAELVENFNFLDDWEDKYRYLLDLGKNLPEMAEEDKNDETKVNGCTSQVWIKSEIIKDEANNEIISFVADSDAHIVRGLIAIVSILFNKKKLKEIKNINADDVFVSIGLNQHLSPSRRNGLAAMVERIKSDVSI